MPIGNNYFVDVFCYFVTYYENCRSSNFFGFSIYLRMGGIHNKINHNIWLALNHEKGEEKFLKLNTCAYTYTRLSLFTK